MFKLRKKVRNTLIAFLFCLCAIIFALPSIVVSQKAYAYTTANMPTGDNAIGNLVSSIDSNGKVKFDKANLKALANKGGYDTFDKMVMAAESGENKTAADFQHSTVKFGKSFGGDGAEATDLVWIPAYLSQSTVDSDGNNKGDAILTLWLATTDETSVFNPQYNSNASTKPSSNNYSTSKIRTEMLNNTGVYYNGYGNTSSDKTSALTAVDYTATTDNTHRFQMYTTGALSSYIVAPADVSWQTGTGGNRMKNDPSWRGNTTGSYFQDKDGNEQTWVNDKLWLPSVYETLDGSIKVNSTETIFNAKNTTGSSNANAAGLWGTNANERDHSKYVWLRSGRYNAYHTGSTISGSGHLTNNVNVACSVRPALHLNLSILESCEHKQFTSHPKETYCDKDGHEAYWECTECGSMFSDSAGTNAIDEPVKIDPTGHAYPDEWITTATDHWHVCGNGCGIKGSEGAHSGGTATCQQKATCSDCGQVYGDFASHDLEHHEAKSPTCTEKGWNAYDACKNCDYTTYSEIAATGHTAVTDNAVEPTCTEEGKTAGSHCSVCDEVITAQEVVPAKGHKPVTDKAVEATCTEAGKTAGSHCSVCNEVITAQEEVPAKGHTPVTDKAVEPTCTKSGKTAGSHCSVCNEVLTAQETVPAKGHTPGAVATCTTAQTCTVCGSEVSPKLGHNYVAVEGGVPPTCTEAGSGKVRCSRCGNEHAGDSIPATGHTLGIAATCTEPQTCSVCGDQLAAALGHDFGAWEVTKPATFTEDGSQRRECSRCDEFETEVIPAKGVSTNEVTLTLNNSFVYGDEISPVITAKYGEVVLKWYDTTTGEELSAKPSTVGSYKLVASVAENLDDGYYGAEKEVEFTISKREITVTINAGSSEQGADLEELSATVTSGSIVGEIPYTLSTNADKATMGTYAITGTCTNDNYQITFVDGVYIVSKKAEDPSGNGEIDLPVDINVEFKVTQSQTSGDYSDLKGLKTGYWAQLWYRNEDGTLGDEFTDKMNCILTLKIPTDIIEAIRGGEEINREKIAEGLKVYYVNTEGEFVSIENFKIAQKEDESWIIKFNYNEKFRAEVVFNAPNVDEPTPEEPESSGIPWWVWLLVGLGSATLLAIIIVIIVIAKRKKDDDGNGGTQYDDAELKAQLAEQGEKIDELLGRDDGGFNTPVELDENGNVIFK